MNSPTFEFGYVSKAHGLDGEVVVRTYDPASDVLDEVDRVLAHKRDGTQVELTVVEVREGPAANLLVRFEQVGKRFEGEALVGSKLFVFRDDLEAPVEGEYFQGDLLGLPAFDEQGNSLGSIAEIWNTGPVPNLVIRGEGHDELLVPFIDEFVPVVDLPGRRVVVRPLQFVGD